MAEVNASYPAGKYYIGDICYALNTKVYHRQWGRTHKYDKGTFMVNYNGILYTFSVNYTRFGDGTFNDNVNNLKFTVDSGTIGIIPLNLCDPKNVKGGKVQGGHIIESSTPIEFKSKEGVFVIGYNNNSNVCIINTNTEFVEDACTPSCS